MGAQQQTLGSLSLLTALTPGGAPRGLGRRRPCGQQQILSLQRTFGTGGSNTLDSSVQDVPQLESERRARKGTTSNLVPRGRSLQATSSRPKRAAVRTSLGSQSVFQRPGSSRATVPLLLPEKDGLPFGLAVEMIKWTDRETKSDETGISDHFAEGSDPAYNLHFVMCGEGGVKCMQGATQPLTAGDSILGSSRLPTGPVTLVAAEGPSSIGGWDLVVLRVVFPTDLKLGGSISDLRPTDTVKAAARDWCQGEVKGPLGQSLARDLLAGVQEAARQGLDAAEARELSNQSATTAGSSRDEQFVRYLSFSDRLHEGFTRHNVALVQLLDTAHAALSAATGGVWLSGNEPKSALQRRPLMEADTFQLPNQTNLLALVFDPLGEERLPFTFGVEVFQRGHLTPPHVHRSAYELFFILSGSGVGFCDGERFEAKAGDTVVFPPGTVHGIDNGPDGKMYLLELMVPNDAFAEFVRQGQLTGLEDEDLCVLIGQGCGIVPHTLDHGGRLSRS